MTMVDMLCDVCGAQPAIGVASTSAPMSVAFCRECASRGADPEVAFIQFLWSVRYPDNMNEDMRFSICTFKDGRYLTFDEWYAEYGVLIDLYAMGRGFQAALDECAERNSRLDSGDAIFATEDAPLK